MKSRFRWVTIPFFSFFAYLTLSSSSSGISGQSTSGCSCHNASSSAATIVTLTGLPAAGYNNGAVYPITVTVTNNTIVAASPFGKRDGFDLSSSAGSFTAIAGTSLLGATEIFHNTPKTATTGTASWTFNWTAPASGSATVVFNLVGNATNGNGNSAGDQWNITTVNVSKAPPLSVSASLSSPILCNGGSTTLNTAALNGTSPYQYKLNAGVYQSLASFTGTPAGTYTVTAKDAVNATATTIIVISQPSVLTVNSSVINNPLCNGGLGSLGVSSSGGTGTKTFTINPLGPQTNTTGNFSGLTAQNYTITVQDANACSSTTSVMLTQPSPLVVTASAVSGCDGNPIPLLGSPAGGTFSVSNPYSGPSTNYTYMYTNGAGCSATSAPAAITVIPVSNALIASYTGGNVCQTRTQNAGSQNYVNASCEMIGSVNASNLGSTDFCVSFLPGFPSWNGEPYAGRVYSITPSNQPAAAANVCLYYTASDLATAGISSNADISITKVGGNGVLGGSGSVTEILNSSMSINSLGGGITEVCFPVTSFSSFYLHSKNVNNIPLSVSLFDFGVEPQSNGDLLTWKTASEYQHLYFTIQQSIDGKSFRDINRVSSKAINGISNEVLSYLFENLQTSVGTIFYRLEMTDINANKTYSPVLSVYHNQTPSISISPNPSSGDLLITSHSAAFVDVYDLCGKKVFSSSGNLFTNLHLPHGMFMVHIRCQDGNTLTEKVIVE